MYVYFDGAQCVMPSIKNDRAKLICFRTWVEKKGNRDYLADQAVIKVFHKRHIKKQSTVLGYFSKITENTELNCATMENEIKEKEQTDSKSANSDLDIDSMSDRDMLKLIICDIRDIKASINYQDAEISDL